LGVCHSNELLVGADFQRRFHYFYYALFTACLLAMSLFYATIHRSASPRCSSMQLAGELKCADTTDTVPVPCAGHFRR